MVANDCDGTGIHDALNTGSRFWAIANDIAETEHSFHGKLINVCEHGGECVDVRVDITKDGEEGVFRFRHGIILMD